jgi:hypothetical protein
MSRRYARLWNVRKSALGYPTPQRRLLGRYVAFDDGHGAVEVSQYARGQQAGNACPRPTAV